MSCITCSPAPAPLFTLMLTEGDAEERPFPHYFESAESALAWIGYDIAPNPRGVTAYRVLGNTTGVIHATGTL